MKTSKRHRRINLDRLAILLVTVGFCAFLLSRIALNAINVSMSITYQNNINKIESLKRQQETLQLDVQKLSTYDRIAVIAASSGMRLNQSNVVFVASDN